MLAGSEHDIYLQVNKTQSPEETQMENRFQLLPAGLEEAQFKRVPEGWLFTTANPWVFGPRRTYLLSDTQKPALAQRVRRSRYIRLALLVPLILMLAAVFVAFPSSRKAGSYQTWLVWCAFMVLFTGVIGVSDYLTIRPMLRELSRSSQKIALTEMITGQAEAMSVRALAILTLIFAVGTAGQTYSAMTSVRLGLLAAIGAIAFAVLTFVFGAMLFAKLGMPYDSSSEKSGTVEDLQFQVDALTSRLYGLERASNFGALGLMGLVVLAALTSGAMMYLFDRESTVPAQGNASLQNITVHNSKGDIVAHASGVGSDGLPVLGLFDGDKSLRAAAGLRNGGTPFLSLNDAVGKSRWLATVGDGTQGPRRQLFDINGTARWSANVNDVNDAVRGADLRLTNADGGGGWFARVTDRGSELRLSDSKGNVRWSVSVDDDGAHVRTFDAAGKELPTQKER